jgi:hypothetical protein
MEGDIQDKGKHKLPHSFDLDRVPARRPPPGRPSHCEFCRTHNLRCVPGSTIISCSACQQRGQACHFNLSPEEDDNPSNRDSAPGEQHRELWTSSKCTKADTQDVDA